MDMSIPLQVRPPQIENPANAMARILQLKGMQQEQSLNAMRATELQNNISRSNKMRELLGQEYATPEARESALLKGGYVEEASKLGKDRRENAKNDAETGNKRIETAAKRVAVWRDTIGNVGDPRAAAALIVAMHGDPELKDSPIAKTPVEVWLKDLPDDPKGFDDWKKKFALGATEYIKQNAPKTNVVNTGGSTTVLQTPGLGGAPQIAGTMQNTQSPDNAASNARQAADAAAGRSVTMRGQDMTDQRQRDANAITAGKPSAALEKELVGIRQQNAIVDGALAAVAATPSAFSLPRGLATMAGAVPESLAGRADSDAERQARSYVFNNVSKVINERAGAAQSAQELARLRAFLPAETDNAEQIRSKLTAFKTYLTDMEAGTRGVKAPQGGATGGWSIQRVN